jgi:hypothetical protein
VLAGCFEAWLIVRYSTDMRRQRVQYVLDHHYEGERQRLALMSRLLDPMHRPRN